MRDEIASLARMDLAPRHRQPFAGRVLLATVAAIGGSLGADAILAAVGEAVFPAPSATCTSGSMTMPTCL